MRLTLAFFACLTLAACGDPLARFELLSDQDISDETRSIDVVSTVAPEDGSVLEALLAEVESKPALSTDTASEPAERGGLFGLFQRDVASAPSAEATPASLREPEPKAGGFLGLGTRKQAKAAPETVSEISPGTVLPYGKVARICGLSPREMGKKIAQYPERSPRHKIYDSNPGGVGPHSFFITGFSDGCARQVTASVAVFGSAGMHEQLRYGLPSEVQPYSDTDKAYEKIKSKVCGVPRRKPCGAKVSRLERTTVFVSVYERFGSNPYWTNLLIHDGQLFAQDQKGG